jgi:hypothetical protein
MVKKVFGFFMCFLVLVLASPVWGQYVVDLDIPLRGQLVYNWCGAASAEMLMEGYPDPASRCYYTQAFIWDTIQDNNLPGEPANWATDPHGLQQTLLILCPPPTGTWSLYLKPVREELMFDILYWMNRQLYGTATLVWRAAHWVVIKGFQTDVEPVAGSNPVLQEITIHNPLPVGVGETSTMTGAIWYSNYWYGPINAPGTWYGNYVGIIEPPPVPLGKVYAAEECRIGETIISPQEAIDYANYWKKKLKLGKKNPAYALLWKEKKKAVPLEPILVREEITPGLEGTVPYYYIIPYAKEDEVEQGLSRVSVLINAFTGNFEEVTGYEESIKYLKKNKALEAVAGYKELTMEEMSNAQAEVVFTPCSFTYFRSKPFWRIEVNNEVAYVEIYCPDQVEMAQQDPCIHEDPIDPPEPIYGK